MTATQRVNLALRVSMEVGIVAAFATWGAHVGGSTGTKVTLGVLAPAVAFGFWGAVDFHRAGPISEPLRLTQELVVTGLAAVAWWAAGQALLGIALAVVSLGYHGLVYATGERLIKQRA